ncbi:hypothetical protein C8J57DRAFT_328678 [Mycena rebaudengoi]|nr:hypothetical protein C8J57DRAFT_328678 [Mycena rebaudengoi]
MPSHGLSSPTLLQHARRTIGRLRRAHWGRERVGWNKARWLGLIRCVFLRLSSVRSWGSVMVVTRRDKRVPAGVVTVVPSRTAWNGRLLTFIPVDASAFRAASSCTERALRFRFKRRPGVYWSARISIQNTLSPFIPRPLVDDLFAEASHRCVCLRSVSTSFLVSISLVSFSYASYSLGWTLGCRCTPRVQLFAPAHWPPLPPGLLRVVE